MELLRNLHHMCRICAVNIKKRRSSTSAVSILDTTQLIDKLKLYLNIDVTYNDALPKSMCTLCYKKVEAIHALSALAKKTENFLTDFIKIAQNNIKQQAQTENLQLIFNQNEEFNQYALLDNNDGCINDNDVIYCEDDLQQQSQSQSQLKNDEPEEVVLNFTLNDPLTKDIQKKIVVAKQKKQQQQQQQQQQQNQQNILNQRLQLHKKYKQDLLELSTSITPSTTTSNKTNDLQSFNKRSEILEQKRQNLKMILNNNTTTTTSTTVTATTTTNNATISQKQNNSPDYKFILPKVDTNQSSNHNLNVGVQNQQQQSTTNYSTSQQQTSELTPQLQNILINNNRSAQMMNEYLNLGSVIKDMDLLKLILKALKWPFNQETLNAQIQRLKNTRFRDVMIDTNLLQDTDLMQILSSYLSPILLQTSPTQLATSSACGNLTGSSNILPPSVSYKIPAETSVRLVSVPRDEQHQQNDQKQQIDHEKYQEQSLDTTISTLPLQHQSPNYVFPDFDYKIYQEIKKTNKKHHFKLVESYQRRFQQQQQNFEPIIVLSDDESYNSSDNIQKFEVNVDPMLYFNGADSSYENSNESTMVTMGYFKQQQQQQNNHHHHHHQQQQQHQTTALNSEVTLEKRKKQKRKQTLIQNPINRNTLDQEISIIDENGEKPLQLNNELSCTSTTKMKLNVNNNMPSTSTCKDNFDEMISSFEFTTPKKRRKLNTLKSSKDNYKNKVPLTDSMFVIHKHEFANYPLHKEIKLEKNLNDVSIIAVNKNYDSTNKSETPNKQTVDVMPKTYINNDNTTIDKKIVETFDSNIDKDENELKILNNNENNEITIEKLNKPILEDINDKNNETVETSREFKSFTHRDDDADSVDTNDELVIDEEAYDEEKLKDDDNKIDDISEKESENGEDLIVDVDGSRTDPNAINNDEDLSSNDEEENISKTKENNSMENNNLRRSRRQTKFKTPILRSALKKRNTIKKNLVKRGANVKKTVVSTRGKTRQQEQKSKMQTRNSNISQRGRKQKPYTKYSKKKS